MSKLLRLTLIALLLLPLLRPEGAHAQTDEECKIRVNAELLRVHDVYRSYLFGSRMDDDGVIRSKTGGEVDKVRTGIFERKRRLTSEFVAPTVQAYRWYRCQNLMVCENMEQSFGDDTDEHNVRLLGCAPKIMPLYEECIFVNADQKNAGNMTNYCSQTVQDTLSFERDALKLAVAYDAGYRAMVQFTGMVDWMLKDMPTRNFLPLRSMVNLLGKLYQIPCFVGQCDMPNNSDLDIPGIPSM